jgi:hypothetical protein
VHNKPVQVTAIVVFGSGVDKETGLRVNGASASRLKAAARVLLRARQRGEVIIILAPGKPNTGDLSVLSWLKLFLGKTEETWRSPQTFAEIMATELRHQMSDIADHELIVNDSDDEVWTSWGEINWAIDAAKRCYRNRYKYQLHQMVSDSDYSYLRLVFVSDRNHLALRIPLMARLKLRYWFYPPWDDRLVPEQGMRKAIFATEPRWSTAPADHKPIPMWYEVLATVKFIISWLQGNIR